MNTLHNPKHIAATFSNYAHGVETPEQARWLHVSGQVGVLPNGQLAEGPEAQMEQCWRNILAILESANMGATDVVKVVAYLTHQEDVKLYRDTRDRMLDGLETASTLLVISGLAHPDWRVEIEVIAAQ